jgi:hypothetical protein
METATHMKNKVNIEPFKTSGEVFLKNLLQEMKKGLPVATLKSDHLSLVID